MNGYKTLFISKPCKISIQNDNLIIDNEDGKHTVVTEDIASIVIETQRATLTTYAIARLAQAGVSILYVDKKFSLNAITLPFHTHSTFSKIVHTQVDLSKPLQKQLWQKLIKAKISNQADVLAYYQKQKSEKTLRLYAKEVKSGDSDNSEAKAAKIYWSELFDESFRRITKGAEDSKNAALNYTYAVVRSAIIRSVANAGLIPAFGIHHKNYFNPFNLADDLIEPFRPLCDIYVKTVLKTYTKPYGLDTTIKPILVDILNSEYIAIDQGVSSMRVAIDIVANSFQKTILQNNPSFLLLPTCNFDALDSMGL